jgi:hypothetical protein
MRWSWLGLKNVNESEDGMGNFKFAFVLQCPGTYVTAPSSVSPSSAAQKKIGTVLAHQHRKARESPQKAPGRRFHRHPIPHMEEGSRRKAAAPDPVDGGPRTEHDSVQPVDTESGISTWVRLRFVFRCDGTRNARVAKKRLFLKLRQGLLIVFGGVVVASGSTRRVICSSVTIAAISKVPRARTDAF